MMTGFLLILYFGFWLERFVAVTIRPQPFRGGSGFWIAVKCTVYFQFNVLVSQLTQLQVYQGWQWWFNVSLCLRMFKIEGYFIICNGLTLVSMSINSSLRSRTSVYCLSQSRVSYAGGTDMGHPLLPDVDSVRTGQSGESLNTGTYILKYSSIVV